MREKNFVSLLILLALVAACTPRTTTPPIVITQNPIIPAPTTEAPHSYPPPAAGTPIPTHEIYPAPGTPTTGTPVIPPSGYEPQPGDSNMRRDPVYLDITASKLVVSATDPVQVQATLNGNLPDPKHVLRVVVTPPDAQNVITIEAYSLVPPGIVTTQVLQPFSAIIPLGSYANGEFTVMVNGEKLDTFSAGFAPQPGDEVLTRGEVSLDLAASQLVTTGTQPIEATVILSGQLPDPCHKLRVVVAPADSQNKINLAVYSVFDPQTMCIQVIQPFQVSIPLGNIPSGHYSVYVNGQLLGEFDA